MPMMSDYEEDLDDFAAENIDRLAECLVGTYRGVAAKIPPLFDVSTSWFKYEELIDDWLDLTVLEAGKRGPALRNRLVGGAEMHKGLLNWESLRAERRWSQVFQGYFETPFHHWSPECVHLEILSVHPCKKRKH